MRANNKLRSLLEKHQTGICQGNRERFRGNINEIWVPTEIKGKKFVYWDLEREVNYLKVSGTNKVNNLKDLPKKERLRGSRTWYQLMSLF